MMKCKVCKEKFTAKYFLQKTCVEPYCLATWIKSERERKRSIEVKVNRKAVVELNKRSLKYQHKLTQPVFNKLRRLQEFKWFSDRGLEPVCISCGKSLGNDQWCNGHLKSVGANGRLRYDFMNSYLQHNKKCNMALSGDIKGYELGLVLRFGEEKGNEIIKYCEENNAPIKRTWQDIEALRKYFNQQIKALA